MRKRYRISKTERSLSRAQQHLNPTQPPPTRTTKPLVKTSKSAYLALALAIAPALGYFYAFTYEKGYMAYFSVPQHYISLNIVTVITGTMFILTTITYVFLIISATYTFLLHFKPTLLKQFNQVGFVFTICVIVFFGLYVYGRGFGLEAQIFLFMIVIYIFKYYILPLMSKEFGTTLAERFVNYQKQYAIPQELFVGANKQLGIVVILKYSVLLFLIIYLPQLIGDNYGYREARTERDFLVLSSVEEHIEERVVLRIYDYNAILAPFNRSTREVSSEFTVINIRDSELTLKLERIGPLVPSEYQPAKKNGVEPEEVD